MNYSLRELECFLAVAEELSFTRAARRLHLAQPPLSRHVKTLEEKIGAQLFVREPRSIALTSAGRSLYEEVRHVPALLARAGEQARRQAKGEGGQLRIGFVSAVMGEELMRLIRDFRRRHPEVEIMLHDLPPGEQLAALAEGRLDGGFVGVLPARCPPGVTFKPWFQEPVVCLVAADHPLARRTEVRLEELRSEPFVSVSRDAAPAFVEKVRDLCRRAGFRPRVVLESQRAQAVALMVAAGSGVALLPESVAPLVKDLAMALRLKGSPKLGHAFAMRSSGGTPWLDRMAAMLKR